MFFFNSFYFALQHFIENARNILLGWPAKTNFTLNQEWNYSSFMKRSLNFITEPILYPFNGSLNKSCLMNKKWGFLDTFEYHKQTWNYGIFGIWWRERWILGWTPTKTASRKWAFFVVDLHCRECTIFLCHLRISFIFSLHHNSFMWSL